MENQNMTTRPTILAVDDSADIIALISGLLKDLYKVKVANSGESALNVAISSPPDLILLDILMPDMDGYEVCGRLKNDPATRDVPVIFLTAKTDSEDEEKGFELGAVDYITKPISPSKLLSRVKTHTTLRRAQIDLLEWNSNLKRKVINNAGLIREKTHGLDNVSVLASAFSNYLKMSGLCHFTHANNVGKLACEAARRMSLDSRTIKDISLAAQLHDIGKLTLGDNAAYIPPSEMSDSEQNEYYLHPQRSQAILEHIEPLHHVTLMIRHHHEAFNGTGFPDKLKGDAIPLGAQLIGIADLIDHTAQSAGEGRTGWISEVLNSNAGTLFDPKLITYFCDKSI